MPLRYGIPAPFESKIGSGMEICSHAVQIHAAVDSKHWPELLFQSARRDRRIRSSPTSARISATWGEGFATVKQWPAWLALA